MMTAHSMQCGCPTRCSGNVPLGAVDVSHSVQWRHPTRSSGDGTLKNLSIEIETEPDRFQKPVRFTKG
ncbi:MAG: hypothetical protein LBK94_02285 [Prevotellaceae bacterium]|nr:hypothetical protein [Prevotellaceae bacterium]